MNYDNKMQTGNEDAFYCDAAVAVPTVGKTVRNFFQVPLP